MPLPPAVSALLAGEDRRRSLAWLALPQPLLAGQLARPLTLRMFQELRLVNCAFVEGRAPLWGDVWVYAWRVHPCYYRPRSARRFFDWPSCALLRRRLQALARQPGTPLADAVAAIRAHLEAAFADAPGADVEPDGKPRQPNPLEPRAHVADSLIHWAASTYGWRPSEILDLPLAALCQLQRAAAIQRREDVVDPIHARVAALLAQRPAS